MAGARLYKLPAPPLTRQSARLPLARALIENNTVTPWQVFYALQCEARWDASLPEILTARGWITDSTMRALLADRHDLRQVDLKRTPPAADVATLLAPEFCLHHNVLPWARLGETTILVTGRPERLDGLRTALPAQLRAALFAVADSTDVESYIALHNRQNLTKRAESNLPKAQSCRGFAPSSIARNISLLLLVFAITLACLAFPKAVLSILLIWTLTTLVGASFLRAAALWQHFRPDKHPGVHVGPNLQNSPQSERSALPRISVLVPLFRETRIATALIQRLTQLTYPRALLEVVLVLEEQDHLTRATINRTRLPRWMRVVEVPAGSGITTKPRALNYALPFCRGDIIGVWDAEDAPAPDQLENVATHFAQAPEEVACLQGVLDYYNPYTNWLSRCFAIEYAAWFRLVLPGLLRLGFPIPLGGTTLFFRRKALEAVGCWDSHNVTEDADLGMRLARCGYRTELLNSVTQEEANCRPIAWVRQRSRWLKGYMATYLVHMRAPRILLQELGLRQFLGFQLLFLCTLSQFLLAPLLWLMWGAAFGAPSSLTALIPTALQAVFFGTLLLAGLTNGALWIIAVGKAKRPRLYKWVLTMALYFPLATLAAYKGAIEMLFAPFYWDKTCHGKTSEGISHGIPAKGQNTAQEQT